MKIALIGGVNSTFATLQALYRHGFSTVDVYGYEPVKPDLVSGYKNLKSEAEFCGYSYQGFRKINDHALEINAVGYDVIFVVGLSQLVSNEVISGAKIGCVGFHPTKLPKGRGRAPLAWLILSENEGSATFFQIKPDQEADAGPILVQSIFPIERDGDTAASIREKILNHIYIALDKWLPELARGAWITHEQDHSLSSEYGIRKPEDGFINWLDDVDQIKRHIRSAMPPHPGAMVFIGSKAFKIQLSSKNDTINIKGVKGRVLKKEENNYLIQAGNGCVWVETDMDLKIGTQLGVLRPYEMFLLHEKISQLEEKINKIGSQIENQ
jgi:methionyl-tRNA formyltransferase